MKALADEQLSHEKIGSEMVQLMQETSDLRKVADELKQTLSQGGKLMWTSTHQGSYSPVQYLFFIYFRFLRLNKYLN